MAHRVALVKLDIGRYVVVAQRRVHVTAGQLSTGLRRLGWRWRQAELRKVVRIGAYITAL